MCDPSLNSSHEVWPSPFGAHFHWWPSPLRPQPSPPQEKTYLPLVTLFVQLGFSCRIKRISYIRQSTLLWHFLKISSSLRKGQRLFPEKKRKQFIHDNFNKRNRTELKFGTWKGFIVLNILKYNKLSHKSRDMSRGHFLKIANIWRIGDAYFPFVNGRCHFWRSMPSLVTKPFLMVDVIYALD